MSTYHLSMSLSLGTMTFRHQMMLCCLSANVFIYNSKGQGRMWVEYMEIFFFASHYQKNSEAKTYPETKYLLFLKLRMCLCICFGCEGNMGFVLSDNIKTL